MSDEKLLEDLYSFLGRSPVVEIDGAEELHDRVYAELNRPRLEENKAQDGVASAAASFIREIDENDPRGPEAGMDESSLEKLDALRRALRELQRLRARGSLPVWLTAVGAHAGHHSGPHEHIYSVTIFYDTREKLDAAVEAIQYARQRTPPHAPATSEEG